MAFAARTTSIESLSRSVFATRVESFEMNGITTISSLTAETIEFGGFVEDSWLPLNEELIEFGKEATDLSSAEMLAACRLPRNPTDEGAPSIFGVSPDGVLSLTARFLGGRQRR